MKTFVGCATRSFLAFASCAAFGMNILIDLPAPVNTWVSGIPLGNARTGAMLWGGGDTLNVTLDCQDFWLISENDAFKNPAFTWTNFLAYTTRTLKERNDIFVVRSGDSRKLPGVRLVMKLDDGALITRFRLDADEAVAYVTVRTAQGTERAMRAWFEDDGATHLSLAKPDDIGFSGFHFATNVAFARHLPPFPEPDVFVGSNVATYRRANRQKGRWAKPFEAGVRIVPEKTLRDNSWWRHFHAESSVHLPDRHVQKMYDFAMYLYGAASRAGYAPIALQGLWSTDLDDDSPPWYGLPPWHGDYHHDMNSEMTYWGAHIANHFECHDAYAKHVVQLLPMFESYARRFFGVSGAVIPGHMAYDGSFIAGWAPYAIPPTHGLWSFSILYDGWAYRPTQERLEEIWPLGKALAEAADQLLLPPDIHGVRRWPISVSPEFGLESNEAFLKPNSSYDRSIIIGFFTQMATLADVKGEKDMAMRYRKIAASAGPAHVAEGYGYLLAENLPLKECHLHFSNLMDIFPYDQVAPGVDPAAALDAHESYGILRYAGHSMAQAAVMRAHVGNGNRALHFIRLFSKYFCAPNGLHLNAYYDDVIDARTRKPIESRPFTLEANFGVARAVQEMLLQSRPGEIRLFPALPSDWDGKEVSFNSLVAVGGHRVSAVRHADGTFSYTIDRFDDRDVKVIPPPNAAIRRP